MTVVLRGCLVEHSAEGWSKAGVDASIVGCKAMGLAVFPPAWRPPFVVLPTSVYEHWLVEDKYSLSKILADAASEITTAASRWNENWLHGIILRSSASSETMGDRGQHESLRLTRDFNADGIVEHLAAMFTAFRDHGAAGSLAVIVQPIVKGKNGHLSNEKRVAKTRNHWEWANIFPDSTAGRINSQRDEAPSTQEPLLEKTQAVPKRLFRSVGRWLNDLQRGRAHLEWTHDGEYLWLLQVDFENEVPDDGVDPHSWFRDVDHELGIDVPQGSPFRPVNIHDDKSPWRKISKIGAMAQARAEAFPKLIHITGDQLLEALANGYDLTNDLQRFTNGRVVCRTDCINKEVSPENLPRTHTVTAAEAVSSMREFLVKLQCLGADACEVCFILHKFIPARAGAWVKAEPSSNVVKVDSLWGVPDGLQYLPHDTFEFDVGRGDGLSERIRFKSKFIQEDSSGKWSLLAVKRSSSRHRSLLKADLQEIATASHRIATAVGEPVLIMWFCGLPPALGLGRNLPWFRMRPNSQQTLLPDRHAPRWQRIVLRTVGDIDRLQPGLKKHVLVLDPELDLIRDDKKFLERAANFAKTHNLPIELAGSSLAHAFYMLEKEGITVMPADGNSRSRIRGRRKFDKLVRDNIPENIQRHGEIVVRTSLLSNEMRQALVAKLFEEAQELLAARDPNDVKEEIADLYEVVRALASITGTSWEEVKQSAEAKRERRGGFDRGEVLVETALPASQNTKTHAPAVISLRQLGKIENSGLRSVISFNALLSALKNGAEIIIDGKKIRVRLRPPGLEIILVEGGIEENYQLSLDI